MSTTAPMAPRTSSSHMNQKRSWPGVPNRYRIRSSPSVMRPKSMATVVVVLVDTLDVSSTPSLTLVRAASVVRGSISEMEPMKVVFPTAKPPATTIFTGMGPLPPVSVSSVTTMSEGLEAIEDPFEESEIGAAGGRPRVQGDEPLVDQVAEDDTGDAQGQAEPRRDLGGGLGGRE